MTWNYRVIKQEYPEGTTTYAIYEVYYDEQDNIQFITKDPVNPHGETIEELRGDLEYMLQALNKPVLNMDELDKLFAENAESIRNAPGFSAECRRQSHLIRDDPYEMHDLDMLAEIADWGEE